MSDDFMIPSTNMPSMNGRSDNFDGTRLSSTLSHDQAILMEATHLNPLVIPQNNSDSDVPRIQKSDFDSATKSESGAFEENQDLRPKRKKRYHRHTQLQIQEMETFFKMCPHPDDKQRKELSREIGLMPLQIKFWFQNKRTQLKAQHDRDKNTQLKTENEKLRADNLRFKEALKNASCHRCGGQTAIGEMSLEEYQLRLKNAHLREEIDRISAIAAKFVEKPVVNYPIQSSSSAPSRSPQLRISGASGGHPGGIGGDMNNGVGGDKPIIIELAIAAMKELIEMAQMGEPLWLTTMDGTTIVLNEEEYNKCFPQLIGPKPIGFNCEASQESAIVFMNHVNLIEVFMDVDQWATMFTGIVSSAMTLEVLSTGVPGSYNDVLQVMTAEFQVPSPYTPNRESNFIRYCKQHNERTWAIVDVSLDKLRPYPAMRCRKKPSGCIIQELPNGYSKVIWIEHVEVDNRGVHNLFKQLVSSGHAFGAKRWITTLDRQCERLASAMATTIPTVDVGVINLDGRKNLLELAERMVISFFDEVSACTTHSWETLSGTNDIRIVTRKNIDDPGNPIGLILSAAATLWLPHSPKKVFEFLCNKNFRSEWDLLSKGGVVQEMAHIPNGRNIENYVSILSVNDANPAKHCNMSILQESRSDSMGSFLIYAPLDLKTMNAVLDGSIVDPDYVAILPSGFTILPDGNTAHGGGIGDTTHGGSLLTMAYQILVDPVPTTRLSLGFVAHVNNLIDFTAASIKGVLSREVA